MTKLNDAARRALTSDRPAHLVTIEPDGRPQITLVWVGLDGDDIVFGHLAEGRKLANLRRDPRVALSVQVDERTELGLDQYLVVHGTARLVPGGAPELLQELAHTYIGPGVKFPPHDDPPAGHVVRITVDRVGGVGPWS